MSDAPKYEKVKDVIEARGFIFKHHERPFDVYIKDEYRILFCQPCMILAYYKGEVLRDKLKPVYRYNLERSLDKILIK